MYNTQYQRANSDPRLLSPQGVAATGRGGQPRAFGGILGMFRV